MVSPVNSSSSGRSEDSRSSSASALCEEVSPLEFCQKAANAPQAWTDDYESATVDIGVVAPEIGDCIALFGISRELDISFVYHINGLMNASEDDQEKMVKDLLNAELVGLDESDGYRGIKFELFLVGGNDAPHSEQLGRALEKVMPQFFDVEYCDLDTSLLNPDREGNDFITAYLSSEGKIYFYFHDEQ